MPRWSYSKLSRYEKCPYQLVLGKTVKRAPNEFMERGNRIHKEIENAINGIGPTPKLDFFVNDIHKLIDQNAKAELSWDLNDDWTVCQDPKKAYGTCIIDAFVKDNDYILIIDFKTGKPSPISHQDQSQTYAIAGHAYYPDYSEIHTQFWYLDSGKVVQHTYTPTHLDRYRTILDTRIKRMLNDTELRPKPNKYVCKWCSYKEHCDYNAS